MRNTSTLYRIKKILDFLWSSERSDFYRKKFQIKPSIKTWEEFEKLPFLTKNELLTTPPQKRLYLPFQKIVAFEVSSGTTDKPLVIFDGEAFGEQRRVIEMYLNKCHVKTLLTLLAPINAFMRTQVLKPKGTLMVVGDLRNLPLTAELVEHGQIDGIRSTPTILSDFLPYLEEKDLAKNIRLVLLGGEFCTTSRFSFLKKKLSNAKIYFSYGSVETLNRGYQCEFLATKSNPQYFHPLSEFYYEIIGSELTVTNLTIATQATPLLRYKTGDEVEISAYKCRCGQKQLLKLVGRANWDQLRVGGGVLHVQTLENVLSKFPQTRGKDFRLHVFEKAKEGFMVVSLELEVVIDDKNEKNIKFLEKEIAKNLYLSPNLTLEDFIKKGIFSPLVVKARESIEGKRGDKKKYIISHLH